MPDPIPPISGRECPPGSADSWGANLKMAFDSLLLRHNEQIDRQRDYHLLAVRIANNAATIDHAINAGLVNANQVGSTEAQQTVSPAGTAASETAKGAVADAGAGIAVSAQTVASSLSALTTGMATAITALETAVGELRDALAAVVVTAAGGASTPSQTKPPTA